MTLKPTYHLFISSLLVCLVAFSFQAQVQNNGNMRMHNANIGLWGDMTNNGTFDNNTGNFYLVGANATTLNGTNYLQVDTLTVTKTNTTHLDQVLEISSYATFSSGILTSDRTDNETEFFHFTDDASHSGAKDASHVDGVVRKTGNDAFEFPVGNKDQRQYATISAPLLTTDHFTAYYVEEDPDPRYPRASKQSPILTVSSCEYWVIDRTNGSSQVVVELEYDLNSCGLNVPCEAIVTHYDTSANQWQDRGNGGALNLSYTSIKSGSACTSPGLQAKYGPFTFGSLTGNNPLPVTLVSFEATLVHESQGKITWETASEINSDYFIVEKSTDGKEWTDIARVYGAGHSTDQQNYEVIDYQLAHGLNYYRLKQVDFDGKFEIFDPQSITYESGAAFQVSPNPFSSDLQINFSNIGSTHSKRNQDIEVLNAYGQLVQRQNVEIQSGHVTVQLEHLSAGIYYIRIFGETRKVIKL